MNGIEMLLRSFGRDTKEANVNVQSAVLDPTNANRPHITKRNVFEEMDLSQSFETKIKSEVWRKLVDHIECGNFTQAELAQRLQIHQPDVSDLLRGKFSKFSTDKLIRYADKLDLQVQFRISTSEIDSEKLEHA